MRLSLANVIALVALLVYWVVHLLTVVSAFRPIAAAAQKAGLFSKDLLELPIIGILAAPIVLLFDTGDFLKSTNVLLLSMLGLPIAAGVLGAFAGLGIRLSDPYGTASAGYLFSVACALATMSALATHFLYPAFLVWYVVLAIPATPITTLAFLGALHLVANANRESREA